jgi:hypothetical protein
MRIRQGVDGIQGWRYESKVFPELNKAGGDHYTQAEIRGAPVYMSVPRDPPLPFTVIPHRCLATL